MSGNKGMQQLIPLINKLQDTFAKLSVPLNLDLPQIAVVGSQSAGKSSVLENFVGRDFLPRGSGIVTRRPLVLQLINDSSEYGEFVHCKQRFTDFEDIRKEIQAETDRLTGKNKGISNVPINLRIHSPQVLNLTLIDLPGITKIAVGDQPKDIEMQIRGMIAGFIEKDSCLILAVTPANADLANSDALKMAKEFDPDGLRTIGVLTKLDLMDHGTDAKDVLENRLLPLRRGYVGIVNRSQRDIEGRKDIEEAMQAENRFFLGHAAYRHMAERMGTGYLQKVLNEQLTNHIRESLPTLRSRIQSELTGMQREVDELKKIPADDPNFHTNALMRMLRTFEAQFSSLIDGQVAEVDTQSLSGGAEISRIFHERFPYELFKKLDIDEKQLRKEIGIAIQNIHGVRRGIFTPDKAFEAAVRTFIERMREPSLLCVDQVVSKLTEVIHQSCKKVDGFPPLRNEILRIATRRIRELEQSTKDEISKYLEYNMIYTNTNHDDFIGFDHAKQKVVDTGRGRLGNQVMCKGYLSLIGSSMFHGGSRYLWFVLTSESLSWYKNEDETEVKYQLPLEGLKHRSGDTGFFSRRPTFIIFMTNPKANVYKDQKTIELAADTAEDVERWKASLTRTGVLPELKEVKEEKLEEEEEEEDDSPLDAKMEREIQVVRNLVDSYMKICRKAQKDMVPKIVIYELIHQLKSFFTIDMVAEICRMDTAVLLAESEESKLHRAEMLGIYASLQEAMGVITDITTNTTTTRVPPPVNNEWIEPLEPAPKSISGRLQANSSHQSLLQVATTGRPLTPLGTGPSGGGSGTLTPSRPLPTRPAPSAPTHSSSNLSLSSVTAPGSRSKSPRALPKSNALSQSATNLVANHAGPPLAAAALSGAGITNPAVHRAAAPLGKAAVSGALSSGGNGWTPFDSVPSNPKLQSKPILMPTVMQQPLRPAPAYNGPPIPPRPNQSG